MNKKNLSERDICTKFINPAIQKAGWDINNQVREEVFFTDGRIHVQGKLYARGKRKFADYILYYKPDIPLAIIEAKDNNKPVGHGMQQAIEYGQILQIPFLFISNGDSFVFRNAYDGTEREISLDAFPGPTELWQTYLEYNGLEGDAARQIVEQDYYRDTDGLTPRYYQINAVNRTLEHVARGHRRALLVMATGTGKTYTAFNIVYRLRRAGVVKRVLFLADRTKLLTQTITGDFSPFGSDVMHLVRNRKIDKSYEIFFALYQGLTSSEEERNVYKEFSRDFFDLIIIDECHRGSADEASAWREVLEYFTRATQVGLTATPKETKDVSNIAYFGDPIYTYSLRQGIDDGFLAPYKVIRVSTSVDEGWRPTRGLMDKYGHAVEDRIYNLRDYDKHLAIDGRTYLVAERITEYLKNTDRFAKTIVFCVDIDHANRMRMALINANADLVAKHSNYVVKITGDDDQGILELDDFMDVEAQLPVIATTSKMLTTGVNTKMTKVIVLEANIGSMTEFKQIIGRGSRLREDDGKVYFTIIDFRRATNLFADPDFDGEPVQVYEAGPEDAIVPEETDEGADAGAGSEEQTTDGRPDISIGLSSDSPRKYYVDNIPVSVVQERVQYYGAGGRLITESLKDYTKQRVTDAWARAEDFVKYWNQVDNKAEIVKDLADRGVLVAALAEEVGQDMDPFDLVCHVAYNRPVLTRKERAGKVRRSGYFVKYGALAQEIIQKLLDKYEAEGIIPLEKGAVLKVRPLNELGSPVQLVRAFGKKQDFEAAVKELEGKIYQVG